MKKTLLFILLLSLISNFSFAEEYHGCEADAITNGASTVYMNDENGTIKFFKLETPLPMHPQGMEAWLKEALKANASAGFRLYETNSDDLGYVHYRFKQTHNGYDVNNGVYYGHGKQVTFLYQNYKFN